MSKKIKVFDDPNEMRKAIEEKNRINNKPDIKICLVFISRFRFQLYPILDVFGVSKILIKNEL